jgi:hypothetical protein
MWGREGSPNFLPSYSLSVKEITAFLRYHQHAITFMQTCAAISIILNSRTFSLLQKENPSL